MITDRRSFISGIAAAGLSAAAGSRLRRSISAFAQAQAVPKTGLIDVHHHIVPPFTYRRIATALSRRVAVELIPLI